LSNWDGGISDPSDSEYPTPWFYDVLLGMDWLAIKEKLNCYEKILECEDEKEMHHNFARHSKSSLRETNINVVA
jgi:hypothetical protein